MLNILLFLSFAGVQGLITLHRSPRVVTSHLHIQIKASIEGTTEKETESVSSILPYFKVKDWAAASPIMKDVRFSYDSHKILFALEF